MPLAARAWIGDGERGALAAADGTIDWWCPTRIAGPPVLDRLLDPLGAAVRVGPSRTGTGTSRRLPPGHQRYRSDTNVVETELSTAGGRLRVVDFVPWLGPGTVRAGTGRIVRLVQVLAGSVDVEVEVCPGPARSSITSSGAEAGVTLWSEGVAWGSTVVRAGLAFRPEPRGRDAVHWRATGTLEAGQELVVSIDGRDERRQRTLSRDAARQLLDDTTVAWRNWVAAALPTGPYDAAVVRSLLTVKALTSSSGAPVAAPTTSLARRPGGERTADDRSVRWRDAATAAGLLATLGFPEEADAAEGWLRTAAQTTPLPWPAALDADTSLVPELEESNRPGWRASQPVVFGRPTGRVDLDLYGDVLPAVSASQLDSGPGPLVGAAAELRHAADWLTDHAATTVDVGVWDDQGPPKRLVASRVQEWAALDATIRRARAANPLDLAVVPWHRAARDLLRWLETAGLAADGGLVHAAADRGSRYTADDGPDAALLRVAWRGPWPARHPIVVRTVDRVLEQLSVGRLVYRYSSDVDDGRAGPDSPDLLGSLWAVRALGALERWEEAHERLEGVLGLADGLGLLAEAADPVSGELLGNYPSTPVHLAVIDAAVALSAGPT